MSRNISFDLFSDKFDMTSGRKSRKFAASQELWNTVMNNCQKSFFSHAEVT